MWSTFGLRVPSTIAREAGTAPDDVSTGARIPPDNPGAGTSRASARVPALCNDGVVARGGRRRRSAVAT